MKYRKLGASDLAVSEISLGSWLTFGAGVDDSGGRACVNAAFDAGINFIDTSNIYGLGAAEEFLGRTLKGRPRSSYVLATKLYFPMTDEDKGLSRVQIHKQFDLSLKRLKTDFVDLYQCHRYDEEAPLEETMEALAEVVKAGKARWIGFSEWSPKQIAAALALSGIAKFVSSQPQYSILARKHEPEVFPLCAKNGIGQIVWSPFAQGILTGKYRRGAPPPPDSRATNPEMGAFMDRWFTDGMLAKVDRLRPIAEQAGMSLSHLALVWVLRRPEVSSAIIGATRPEQVTENAAASGKTLSPDMLCAIDAATA
ncbi:MAG: aldo/keto reductase [Elusimicrobia bacterium CG11_big_fil_rev_8_21_14_0_20_64_6]|nr:MAG: aldo/keto reductase [Elusimicrobia bacterium CG11_big_fil_rev_8_21_14_0_20_64_6]